MNSILDTLLTLSTRSNLLEPFVGVYVFGSGLVVNKPTDFDVLLVYGNVNMPRVHAAKARIHDALSSAITGLDVDFTTLSEAELSETKFLEKVTYRRIKGPDKITS